MVSFFGIEIKRKSPKVEDQPVSFTPPIRDDGAMNIEATGGAYGTYVDLDNSVRTEAELVTRYRTMSLQPELDMALDEICNEAMVHEGGEPIMELDMDTDDPDKEIPEGLQDILTDAFEEIMKMLQFGTHAYYIFRQFYVDGRLYFHAVVDQNNMKAGIQELRYIDPRKIRKIREIKRDIIQASGPQQSGAAAIRTVREYYIYNEQGFTNQQNKTQSSFSTTITGLRISKDSIIHVTSGLMDENGKFVLGYLHKAIKPLNMLRAVEDASVIYRLSRAPERRIFYIDVGNLPAMKAEQHIKKMMAQSKNRLVYDSTTGEIKDDRKFTTLMEDYWFARREGQKSTEVVTLPAGENLGKMDDVVYCQKSLYKALNVPMSRLEPEELYVLGRSAEITRDEVKFNRFIDRVRNRFSALVLDSMRLQLILTGKITDEDWDELKPLIKFKYGQDNYFAELKETEMLNNRMMTLQMMAPYAGMYFSHESIRRSVLKQTDEDQKEMDKQIAKEATNPQFMQPMAPGPDDGSQAPPGSPPGAMGAGPMQPGQQGQLPPPTPAPKKPEPKDNKPPGKGPKKKPAAKKK